MRSKIFLVLAGMFFFNSAANTQFHISTGASVFLGKGIPPKNADQGTSHPTLLGYGIFLYPRYHFNESKLGALSMGLPLTLGMSGILNSQKGGSVSLVADIPVTLDFNMGAGATRKSEAGIGLFFGAGFGYTYTNQVYGYYVNGTAYGGAPIRGQSYGPLAHAGIKARINRKVYFLRGFYKQGLEKEKYQSAGAAIGVSF